MLDEVPVHENYGRWRYYAEVGRPVFVPGSTTTGGMPDLSMCSYTIVSGGAGIRIRPAAAKLRVEFTPTYSPARWDDAALRGYLTR